MAALHCNRTCRQSTILRNRALRRTTGAVGEVPCSVGAFKTYT